MRQLSAGTASEIARQWDQIAVLRHEQIVTGRDVSYRRVIIPCLLELCRDADRASVLDVGCGSGFLVHTLARSCVSIVGVDLSSRSLQLAQEFCTEDTNARFVEGSVEAFVSRLGRERFSLVTANMTLMSALDLRGVLQAVHHALEPGGWFVATLTHPCFWPEYWNYASADWFEYGREIAIESNFRISNESSDSITTHIHRPLTMYLSCLNACGLRLVDFREPFPTPEVAALYEKPWRFPRFLGFSCRREDSASK